MSSNLPIFIEDSLFVWPNWGKTFWSIWYCVLVQDDDDTSRKKRYVIKSVKQRPNDISTQEGCYVVTFC